MNTPDAPKDSYRPFEKLLSLLYALDGAGEGIYFAEFAGVSNGYLVSVLYLIQTGRLVAFEGEHVWGSLIIG